MNKLDKIQFENDFKIKYNPSDLRKDIALFEDKNSGDNYLSDMDNQYISALLERKIGIMKKNNPA